MVCKRSDGEIPAQGSNWPHASVPAGLTVTGHAFAEQALQASWSPAILASVVEKGEHHTAPHRGECRQPPGCSYGGGFISPCLHPPTPQGPQPPPRRTPQ